MQMFHIPTTSLLTIFLVFSTELREFYGFYISVPDESFFSRFKTTFEIDIANLFDSMSIGSINICDKINDDLPDDSPYKNLNPMLIYNTSSIKPRVKENNSKILVTEVNPNIRLDFVNGHFGYFYKFVLLTNGLGIPLSIKFFDQNFYNLAPKDFDIPEEQKYYYDDASLKAVMLPFL
ncbi:hypothetical protein LAV52_01380 [Clostridium sporogenes]|nr:hypothetical protein [Clostridium sporogenes]MCW6109102.1 hypothetical protein [Clostridium sporogenes]